MAKQRVTNTMDEGHVKYLKIKPLLEVVEPYAKALDIIHFSGVFMRDSLRIR